ncbi:DUF5801 repeats-in-toxin domain-containing protein, partial [Tropicimonas sp. IMCC6043]|uniref:DUF5801 repeats-in-toxin domain-containing protein n=2 Tax=Tropicimonas sp. IMCC6043 TaxID=2510645 RepID=UPI001A926ABB
AVTYALNVVGGPDVDSGLVDTLTNESVVLNLVGGVVIGSSATGGEVFRVSVDTNTGQVTLDQSRAVVHPDSSDPDDSIGLTGSNKITLTATATDGDYDTATDTVDITGALNLEDDAPSFGTQSAAPSLTVDESDFTTDDSADFSTVFDPQFGNDGFKDADDNDVEDDDAVTYALSVKDLGGATVYSGLTDTLSNEAVVLTLEGGDVVGRTETGGLEVFRVSVVENTGAVTLDQSRAVLHPDATDPDDTIGLASSDLVILTATATDGDLDTDTDFANIGGALFFKDDAPGAASNAVAPVEEDDLATALSTGNNEDASVNAHTATIVLDPDAGITSNIFTGADKPVSFNISDVDPNTVLPALLSMGDLVTYVTSHDETTTTAGDTDVIRAYANYGTADQRLVFTFSLVQIVDALDPTKVKAEATLTLNDQLDNVVDGPPGAENNLLQLSGGGSIGVIDFSGLLDMEDADHDPIPSAANLVAYSHEDDIPIFTAPIQGGTVDFDLGDTITRSLNGAVGTDDNGADDLSGDGTTKTYTFESYTDSIFIDRTGTENDVLLRAVASADNTVVTYKEDLDGDATTDDFGQSYFEISLDQDANSGAGSYTFEVLKDPPEAFLSFVFTGFPSGDQAYGVFNALGGGDSDGSALLVFSEGLVLDPIDNKLDKSNNTGGTSVNSSNVGGFGIALGVSGNQVSQYEAMYFAGIENPEPDSIVVGDPTFSAGLYDDGDYLNFTDMVEATTAKVQLVQVNPTKAALEVGITAYDLTTGSVGEGATTENEDFLQNPLNYDEVVHITEIRVYDSTEALIYQATVGKDGTITPIIAGGDPAVSAYAVLEDDGGTVGDTSDDAYSVVVQNVLAFYEIEWDTETPTDFWRVSNEDPQKNNSFDIGGFSYFESQPTPDLSTSFKVLETDFDGDQTISNLVTIDIDGTGEFDSGEFGDA